MREDDEEADQRRDEHQGARGAGTIEGNISPSTASFALKVAIGLTTGVLFYSYLLFTGRSSKKSPLFELQVALDKGRRQLAGDHVQA